MFKSLIGAAVIMADIIAGVAAPAIWRQAQHSTHSHLPLIIAGYAVLVVATLATVRSLVRGPGGGKPAKPAPRPYVPYGGPR